MSESKKDSTLGTIIVAVVVCLVCSIFVSVAAVGLRPIQEANKLADKRRNILAVAGLLEPDVSIEKAFESIDTRVVNLENGQYADDIDAASYDMYAAEGDEAVSLSSEQDIAGIGTKPKHATVYLVKDEQSGKVKTIILPVHGYGLWSTLYGFLALEADGNTVVGMKFYQHAETPGLGGEVDNSKWLAQWPGKVVYDAEGETKVELAKGGVNPANAAAKHQVDGLGGATLTSRGVTNLLRFWTSEQGFKPYLARFQSGELGTN